VFATVKREKMLSGGENVLVALSGGADSMALLNFFIINRGVLRINKILAAHINHGLRGEESERDEAFAAQQCRNLGIELFVHKANVAKEAKESREGIEEAGRRIRYSFLFAKAMEHDAYIATAHTLSDSVETVLLNEVRGCGLRGLSGIPPIRMIDKGDRSIRIIRPLIDCTRSDIEDFCFSNSILYMADSTNNDIEFSRNRIRSRVIPELKSVNPDVESAFLRLMRHAREDGNLLNSLAENKLDNAAKADQYGGYDAKELALLPSPLRKRAVSIAVSRVNKNISRRLTERQFFLLEEILANGGALTLGTEIEARVSQGRFSVNKRNIAKELNNISGDDAIIPLEVGISCIFYGRIYKPKLMTLDEFEKHKKIHKNLLKNSLNYDKITRSLFLRSRRPGDAFHPSGRGVKKTLKKLLGEEKIPAALRDTLPVVCDEQGIVLVGGFGCDERVKIDEHCRRVFVLEKV
jgi:tRNA(Ile)-lysidine synthase